MRGDLLGTMLSFMSSAKYRGLPPKTVTLLPISYADRNEYNLESLPVRRDVLYMLLGSGIEWGSIVEQDSCASHEATNGNVPHGPANLDTES